MPDTPSSPTSEPSPDPKKKRRAPSALNQAQVEAVTKAEQVCLAGQKPAHAAKLAARDISAEFVEQILTDIVAARDTSAGARQSTTGKTTAGVTEDEAEKDLLKALQEVQAAAKQKYSRTTPTMLKDYAVGERLNASRPILEQLSQAIINKLGSDTLPGITPVKVTNLKTLRKAYMDANVVQGGQQQEATGGRKTLAAQVQSITDRRIQIQYAAEAEWPHTDQANAGIRRAFFLPVNKPFNG